MPNVVYLHSFQSINVSHFVMNLRQVFLNDDENPACGSLRISSARFATSMAGNVGAPLHLPEDRTVEELHSFRRTRTRSVQISNNPLAVGLLEPDEHSVSSLDE